MPKVRDASTYPDPTTYAGSQKCLMDEPSYVCDPDDVLLSEERKLLNDKLIQLEQRTRQFYGTDCEMKGITGAIAIVKRVKGSSENVSSLDNYSSLSFPLEIQDDGR